MLTESMQRAKKGRGISISLSPFRPLSLKRPTRGLPTPYWKTPSEKYCFLLMKLKTEGSSILFLRGWSPEARGFRPLPLVVLGWDSKGRGIETPPFRRASVGTHSICLISRQDFLPGAYFIQPFHPVFRLSSSQYLYSRSPQSGICCISVLFHGSQFSR